MVGTDTGAGRRDPSGWPEACNAVLPMRTLCKFGVLACVGLFLATSCSSSDPRSGNSGTGGMSGGTGGAGCQTQHYFSAGCGADVTPVCTDGAGGACYGLACGCNGYVLTGCGHEFPASYAYLLPVTAAKPDGGWTCDPTASPPQ
jgi:hypothetical protein